ncbi:MAG TPA: invasion associated locus B family protein [Kaistia sp.]|nr:invasion associated locus B family protein [Kaistia sp.]
MNVLRIATAVLIAAGTIGVAQAQTPNRVGTFKDWSSYAYADKKGKVCYAASQPKSQKPAGLNRDPAYFMVTARPAENVKSEVSIIIGYPFKEGSKVTIDIDGQKFAMFTKDDGAWVENAAEEASLLAAMRKGHAMSVSGTSKRGTVTTDAYSLAGISASLDAVIKNCPVGR